MEPEDLIQYSQEPATGPHPEPDVFPKHVHTHFSNIRSNISAHLRLRAPSALSPLSFTTKILHVFLILWRTSVTLFVWKILIEKPRDTDTKGEILSLVWHNMALNHNI